MWDFRRYSADLWVIPNILPPDHPSHAFEWGFNEPGNVAGFAAPALAASMVLDNEIVKKRLREIAVSHIDNVFGRNPTGRHFCYEATTDFEGVELGWFKEHQGFHGQLQTARGVLEGSPKETTYPFDPYAGDPGHSEGWVTFNTPWNVALAYLSNYETGVEIYDSKLTQSVQTVSLSSSDIRLGVVLDAPLNFDYDKVESGKVVVHTSRGDHLLLTVVEKTANSTDFVGRMYLDEGRIRTDQGMMPVKPGDVITVTYGLGFFQNAYSIDITM
jgi:hypothetical protein